MKKGKVMDWGRLLALAGMKTFAGIMLVSAIALPLHAQAQISGTDLSQVDGEHGLLEVKGELVDSPCRLSMDSWDQTVDLGTLSTTDLSSPGARSQPLNFTVHLEGCLVASGRQYDERTGAITRGIDQPVVNVSFVAPADFSDPSLLKLSGVEGIALRMMDDRNSDIRLGSRGVPRLLTPGENQLRWTVVAERTPQVLVPGAFRAVADFRLSYD